MKKWNWIIVLIVVLLLVIIFVPRNSEEKINSISVSFENVSINAEIADTPEKIERGLMYRESLGKNEGMLFIFWEEKETNFWMKNTLIPLDMIFLNKDGEIVNIVENAVPCNSSNCILYLSEVPVKYVIEVNAGFVKENEIEVGERGEF
ncbi:hypothetical protein A3K73_04825 [Candidatus Pacearchaeota archaeon RBG_13_36_9]|nr:MAG: hypothetical protein A3K73_04825 [Candidatus Pacearchaeota archaeon RBG_13_36_9]